MRKAPAVSPNQDVRDGNRGREHLQALTRGLQALAHMNRVGVATNGALAKRLGLKYSTAHRILMVLADQGLVRHDKLGRQFVLAGGVRELSAAFHDTPFVDDFALPRMRAWTRRHGLPLLLVTANGGALTVRASTDAHWPVAGERYVAGNLLPALGSSEAAIFSAFGAEAGRGGSRTVRRLGYARRLAGKQGELHISVPVMAAEGLIACLSIRCSRGVIEQRGSLRRWVELLQKLATDLAAGQS